ncbi:hypothetical protein NQ318_012823 [Aromia moschata]|uniref:Beta-galactosidase n=1 Tax=Aromia moschata TaxID=1265417 RepID=A0AAV8X0X5_9CUCU|nr:hypothetical protein NQ318_012823 [Aromia moschata]
MALSATAFQLTDLYRRIMNITLLAASNRVCLPTKRTFTLNERNISLYSGAMYYFRIPKAYWRDRLRKMSATVLNAVETYIWICTNTNRVSDFGQGGLRHAGLPGRLRVPKTAQERPLRHCSIGSFICGEFEFGGFPSWLLREDGIEVRTSDSKYMQFVSRFFNVLMPILAILQFTKGGPIIALQVENEYAGMGKKADQAYLKSLRQLMIVELLVTSDNPSRGKIGTIPELFLMTGNFNTDPVNQLDMQDMQPDKPLMTMEFWSGWFDFWGKAHNTKSSADFREVYEAILSYPSSVNIYMFHGGTNSGFLNGAENLNFDDENSGFEPITSSYDYDSPLTEGGDYTDNTTPSKRSCQTPGIGSQGCLLQHNYPRAVDTRKRVGYSTFGVFGETDPHGETRYRQRIWTELRLHNLPQENLKIEANSVLLIEGRICDTVIILVNGAPGVALPAKSADLDKFGTWRTANSTITLSTEDLEGATLDLVVENWGQVNVHSYKQFKGLYQGSAYLNGDELREWTIYPLEFKKSWTTGLSNWGSVNLRTTGPALYKTVLDIQGRPAGHLRIHGELGEGNRDRERICYREIRPMGPIQTLYLPAPLLQQGQNDIVVFEHYRPVEEVAFASDHVYYRYRYVKTQMS